jgi:GMP synthase (glutamine-hydrolysing)
MSLKILLLQARNPDDPAKGEELKSFAARLELPSEQITSFDLLNDTPSIRTLRPYDALMMGGSGDFYVSRRNLPRFDALLDFLAEVAEIGHPTFASCFGFQCLVQALGGEIVHDPENTEVGTFELELTEEGHRDPLLGSLPGTFLAQLGRKDRASSLPSGFSCLARSRQTPYQAFRVPDNPIWAFQFHPELDKEDNLLRFNRYWEGYAPHMSLEEREKTLTRFRESRETEKLLSRFTNLVFG